jgi:hypothetical protein
MIRVNGGNNACIPPAGHRVVKQRNDNLGAVSLAPQTRSDEQSKLWVTRALVSPEPAVTDVSPGVAQRDCPNLKVGATGADETPETSGRICTSERLANVTPHLRVAVECGESVEVAFLIRAYC